MTRIKTVRMALVAALTFALLGLGGAAHVTGLFVDMLLHKQPAEVIGPGK